MILAFTSPFVCQFMEDKDEQSKIQDHGATIWPPFLGGTVENQDGRANQNDQP